MQLAEDVHHVGFHALQLSQRGGQADAGKPCPFGQSILPGFDAARDRRSSRFGTCFADRT